jgi:hypothetical protein
MPPGACELRRGLSACGRQADGTCQYCGRTFCVEHGSRLDDGQEICSRSNCEKKRRDIIAFDTYKGLAAGENANGTCGEPSCRLAPTSECAKCRAGFCTPHVRTRDIEEYRAGRTIERRAMLCSYCDGRRGLWKKM